MLHDPQIGHRLLLHSTPGQKRQQAEQIIKQRTVSHQLFALKSARVNHDNKHSKVPKSMPGIGHPFWKNRSDHMRSYVMPPAIHKQLTGEKEIPTAQLANTYRKYNTKNWQPQETNMYYMKHGDTLSKDTTQHACHENPSPKDGSRTDISKRTTNYPRTNICSISWNQRIAHRANSKKRTQGKHSLAFNSRNMV